MRKFFLILGITTSITTPIFAQDSLQIIQLKEIKVIENVNKSGIERMPIVLQNVIYLGKKTEVIRLSNMNADLSTNNSRQIFAKVPGLFIWENDGSGIQQNISVRGLSPNRSWEMNVRQNGSDISSDVFGYPEAYYSPPMEAVEKIELIRGSASLQFGPQFGGLLNYQIKKGNPNKKIELKSIQTIGSFGLMNIYNAIGGQIKKLNYYGFFHHRNADGWRENSKYSTQSYYLSADYQFTKKISFGVEYTHSNFLSQQSGGLTDSLFKQNPKQSYRSRNWLSAPWNVINSTFKWQFAQNANLQIKTFGIIAERNSVGFIRQIQILDTINQQIGSYNPRQVDSDSYSNFGSEFRFLFNYTIANRPQFLATGFRIYNGNTTRKQQGIGTSGVDFSISTLDNAFAKVFNFNTKNAALFLENIFQISSKLSLVPGIRLEYIYNSNKGIINKNFTLDSHKERVVILYGIGSEYSISKNTTLYSNISKAYRPISFSELTPSSTIEIVNPNLKDAQGFNSDLGIKGNINSILNFDLSVFYLLYDNKIGTIIQNNLPYKTNIGAAVHKGIESYIEVELLKWLHPSTKNESIRLFASTSFIEAKYTRWDNPLLITNPELSPLNKRVENAPQFINRSGISYQLNKFSSSILVNSISSVFTDASNQVRSNASATIGKLDKYSVFDFTISYKASLKTKLNFGINNLTNEKYATRRASGYPGPGIMPGNGRSCYFSFGILI